MDQCNTMQYNAIQSNSPISADYVMNSRVSEWSIFPYNTCIQNTLFIKTVLS